MVRYLLHGKTKNQNTGALLTEDEEKASTIEFPMFTAHRFYGCDRNAICILSVERTGANPAECGSTRCANAASAASARTSRCCPYVGADKETTVEKHECCGTALI